MRGYLAGALILLMALSACGRPGEQREMASQPQRWQQMHRSMTQDYDSMRTWYTQHMDQMPADLQQMYRQMEQMHEQWDQGHRGMMQGRKKMHDGRGMMGRGMHGGMMRHGVQEWDQQMQAMHQAMAQRHQQAGQGEMARWHERMMQRHQQLREQLPDTTSRTAPSSPEGQVSGSALYSQQCASCHGTSGEGLARAFPPLAQSQWVTGDKQRLIRVLLHGLAGKVEVAGQRYNGVMPAFGARLSDEEVAAVLSYVRSSWGNEASAVSEEEVEEVREQYEGRRQSWSAPELE